MRGSRPPWYRTARSIGGAPWVPFEVARALQEQLDAQRQRNMAIEDVLARAERRLVLTNEQAERALADAEEAREQARTAMRLLAEREPRPEDETARIQRLSEDLARIRERTEQEVALARRNERSRSLLGLVAVYDDLRRGLEVMPEDPDSPWLRGYQAIVQQLEQRLTQAGAVPFGAPGDPFDPEIHEAVGTVPSASQGEIDRVVGVTQVGFSLADGGLLRPAQVVVGA